MKSLILKLKIFILVNIVYNIIHTLLCIPWFKFVIIRVFKINLYELREFVNLENLLVLSPNSIERLDIDEELVNYSKPIFNPSKFDYSPLIDYGNLKKYSATLNDVVLMGESNLILLGNSFAFYNIKQFDFNKKFKYTDLAIKFHKKNKLLIKGYKKYKFEINEGVFLGGNFSWNFYHFFYEILIRFEKANELNENIPIIIDKKCSETPQYLEIISILDKKKRDVIIIDKGDVVKVNKLYYFSPSNIVPPDFIDENKVLEEDVLLNVKSLNYLKRNITPFSSKKIFPKKIYLSRMKASGRRKFNETEVINVLQNFGFTTVFPEELSFSEQISLFSQADFIIGGSGAAFTNLLFCNTSCKVIIFAKNTLPFSGFSTIASFVGFDLVYLTESSSYGEKNDNLHDSFVINTNKLTELIKTVN